MKSTRDRIKHTLRPLTKQIARTMGTTLELQLKNRRAPEFLYHHDLVAPSEADRAAAQQLDQAAAGRHCHRSRGETSTLKCVRKPLNLTFEPPERASAYLFIVTTYTTKHVHQGVIALLRTVVTTSKTGTSSIGCAHKGIV